MHKWKLEKLQLEKNKQLNEHFRVIMYMEYCLDLMFLFELILYICVVICMSNKLLDTRYMVKQFMILFPPLESHMQTYFER